MVPPTETGGTGLGVGGGGNGTGAGAGGGGSGAITVSELTPSVRAQKLSGAALFNTQLFENVPVTVLAVQLNCAEVPIKFVNVQLPDPTCGFTPLVVWP